MKKLAILVTSLVLGASSVALATPSANAYAPTQLRDHRGGGYHHAPASWTTLSARAMMPRGRAVIDVSSRARFSKLALDASGSMFVDKLVITFANGRSQTIEVDKWLMARSAPLQIDLAGNARRIDKILVVGRANGYRSTFSVKAI